MPTYGYRCDTCGNQFDLRQSFHDEPRADCPKCGSVAQRQFHVPPVIYKGSGFYTTDYARKNGASSASSTSDSSTSSSDSSGSGESSSGKSASGKSESSKSESTKSDTGKAESKTSSSSSSKKSDD